MPQIFYLIVAVGRHPSLNPVCTACIYLWGSRVGELLRDSDVLEGEHIRDRRSDSGAVSFVADGMFTLARNEPEIDPGADAVY